MNSDEQTAAAIVADSRNACDETAMEAAIVRALQAAREEGMDATDVDLVAPTPRVVATLRTKAPTGHIIDDAGVVRLIYGRLPMTEDGVMVGVGEYVWMRRDDLKPGMIVKITGEHWIGQWMKLRACYSSYEAAEAAKEGKA